MEITKFHLVSGLFDDSAENIVIHIEYRLKLLTIHIVSDQSNSMVHYVPYNLVCVITNVTSKYYLLIFVC